MIDGLQAITFDFGNTLVPFPAGNMARVVDETAAVAAELTGRTVDEFVRVWSEERLRQFAEDVPEGREADMDLRAARVLYRLRGGPAPDPHSRWNDDVVARSVDPELVQALLEKYAGSFVGVVPVPPAVGPMLARLAKRYRLALISNWPLAASVERFIEKAGWERCFSAVVISQTVGVIKPWPAIFQAAARAMGVVSGPAILHVGDDPGADVVGAQALGWRTAWIRLKPEDSGLPVAPPAPDARPDIVLDSVMDLERALGLPAPPPAP